MYDNLANFRNIPNWKTKKFLEFKKFWYQNLAVKIGKFWNRSFIRYSALLAILPILIFVL